MAQFPIVEGSNLQGRRFVLPRDFAGAWNLVLMPFEIQHQQLVDTWLPFTRWLTALTPALKAYELPTLPRYGAFERMLIDHWMRQGIPDPATRATTITLYLPSVADFVHALDLPHARTSYTLLVSRKGEIAAVTAGAYNPAKGQSILAGLGMLEPFVLR